jgi:hypothetical protein
MKMRRIRTRRRTIQSLRRQICEPLESRTLLSGNGLSAAYYNNADFTGATAARVDATVNFNWKGAQPITRIAGDTFSARWTGQVQATDSQAYTFSTVSDDGIRLWVDGKLVINQWNNHAAREDVAAPLGLVAGRRYDIRLEYYQNYGGSTAQLFWSGPSQPRQIVPQAQLYSTGGTVVTPPDSLPPTTPGGSTPTTDPAPTPNPTPTTGGSLRVSSNGRYLVRADGSPFFYMADTAWQMPAKLNRAEVDQYLQARAAQGFNVVQVVALDSTRQRVNRYGQLPLINDNPATPNDAFFDHVDYIVNQAAKYGIYVAIVPTWGRNVADASRRVFNTTNAYTYGQFLGARYHNTPNVIWINGADWAITDTASRDIWRALANGLRNGDAAQHLITFHAPGGKSSWSFWSPSESWIDFDMIQSGHRRDSYAWDLVTADYKKAAKPVIEGEMNYEDIPVAAIDNDASGPLLDAYDVRKKAYWEIFAGAAGTAYGSNEVYQFATATGVASGQFRMTWQQALSLPGASQMKYLKQLMESHPYLTRVPDQSLVTSATYYGTDHIQATRDANGAYAMVYSGSGKAFTVNMARLAGTVNAAWLDPRTGKVTPVGRSSNTGTRTFIPPTHGYGQDWVLTLDRA